MTIFNYINHLSSIHLKIILKFNQFDTFFMQFLYPNPCCMHKSSIVDDLYFFLFLKKEQTKHFINNVNSFNCLFQMIKWLLCTYFRFACVFSVKSEWPGWCRSAFNVCGHVRRRVCVCLCMCHIRVDRVHLYTSVIVAMWQSSVCGCALVCVCMCLLTANH